MGREARARETREQDCLVVKVVHDPAAKRTTAVYHPNDARLALKTLALGVIALSEEVENKAAPAEAEAGAGNGRGKSAIVKPTGVDRMKVERTRRRGA